MVKRKTEIKQKVMNRIKNKTFNSIKNYFHQNKPRLLGSVKHRYFDNDSILIALYKDMYAISYKEISGEINGWFKTSDKSLRVNQKRIRSVLANWGKIQVKLGGFNDWKRAMKNVRTHRWLSDSNLFMDSFDLRKTGKESSSVKDEKWLWKTNSPAMRCMTLIDGRRYIRKLWGPYYPKTYDSHFVLSHRYFFEEKLRDGVIVADSHFRQAAQNLNNVRFHIKYANPGTTNTDDNGYQYCQLTQEKRRYNRELDSLRARVENPYASIESKFEALSKPFSESDEEQRNLV